MRSWLFGAATSVVLVILLVVMAFVQARETARPSFAGAADRLVIFALPLEQARALPSGAVALGAFPGSRSARSFVREIGFAYPPRTAARPARPILLSELLGADGMSMATWVEPSARTLPAAEAAALLPLAREASGVSDALEAEAAIIVAADAATVREEFEQTARDRRVLVLGVGERTPVWVSAGAARGTLHGGVTRRTGIVTPHDLSATIVRDDAPGSRTGGLPLRAVPCCFAEGEQARLMDRLAARLEQVGRAEVPLTLLVVLGGIALVIAGTLALWAGRVPITRACVSAALLLPAGYLLGRLVPGAVGLRLAVAVAVVAAGVLVRAARWWPWVLGGTAGLLAVLTVAAALSPDGPVALALWGNPLTSARFFGLSNHLAAFVIGPFASGLLALGVPGPRVVALLGLAGLIVGGNVFGANFVAVAILAAGATAGLLVRRYGEVRAGAVVWAAVAAGVAFGLALLLDTVAPVSHGGRAVALIDRDGIGAAWQLVVERARLNKATIDSLGALGWVAFIAAIAAVAALFDWATRARIPSPIRGAVAGGALAAAVSFVVEDSGFFMGSILGLFPWIAYAASSSQPEPPPPLDPARTLPYAGGT